MIKIADEYVFHQATGVRSSSAGNLRYLGFLFGSEVDFHGHSYSYRPARNQGAASPGLAVPATS